MGERDSAPSSVWSDLLWGLRPVSPFLLDLQLTGLGNNPHAYESGVGAGASSTTRARPCCRWFWIQPGFLEEVESEAGEEEASEAQIGGGGGARQLRVAGQPHAGCCLWGSGGHCWRTEMTQDQFMSPLS